MNPTSLPPKIQKLFEKTKPACFGRFVIDVPAETTVVPGPQDFGAVIRTLAARGIEAPTVARARRDEVLSKGKEHPEVTTYETTSKEDGSLTTLIYWRSANAKTVGLEDIEGFVRSSARAFNVHLMTGDRDTADSLRQQYSYIVTHLRARAPDEIPAEPGVCLDLGFIADDSGKYQEIFGIGFRFPSLPDVSFSISSNKDGQTDPPLSEQRREAERAVLGTPMEADYRKVKVLREGKRKVYQWAGEEALFQRPRKNGDLWQEFQYAYPGIRYDKNNPGWDAAMVTGVDQNTAGGKASSLSDDEAVALWDTVLSTIRLRVPGR